MDVDFDFDIGELVTIIAIGMQGRIDSMSNDINGKMMSQEQAEIKELKSLIENVWREYRNLQDQYHKLTGRDYMWLK